MVLEIANRLTDIEITEVALVHKGANNKQFILYKSAKKPQTGETSMDESQLAKLIAATKSGGSAAIEKAFTLLHAEKAKADADNQTIAKELAEAVTKVETIETEKEAVAKELAEEKAKTEAMAVAVKTKEFVEKAASWAPLPGITADELGTVLKAVSDANPEVEVRLSKILEATSAVLKDSTIFKAMGESGNEGTKPDDAWGEIVTKAKGLVEKSDHELTLAQAIGAVMTKEPGLYTKYLEDEV